MALWKHSLRNIFPGHRGAVESGLLSGQTYAQKVLGTGPIAYWPMWETSGLVAHCLVNPAQNGTYVGVALASDTAPDGSPCPLFDGINDYMGSFGASLDGVFNGEELTIAEWIKVFNVGVWSDGVSRYAFQFMETNNSNRVLIFRQGLVHNRLDMSYVANAVSEGVIYASAAPITWLHIAVTASRTADEVKLFINGIQTGVTQTLLGNWDESGLMIPGQTLTGASITTPLNLWYGYLAHFVAWDRPLTPAQIFDIATV